MENNRILTYREHCQIIKKVLKTEKNNFFEMINNQQRDPIQEFEIIKKQFTFHREKAREKEKKILFLIKNKHGINDTDWQWCMEIASNMFDTIKEGINRSRDKEHANFLSIKQKKILADYLHLYHLNINKINLKNDFSGPGHINPSFNISIDDENLPIHITISHPEINYNSSLKNFPKCALIKTAWLFGNQAITELAILYPVMKKSNKNYSFDDMFSTLKQTDEFEMLRKIHITFSDILSSLDDYKACKWITKELSLYPPQKIDNKYEHFQELYTIKTLWKKYNFLQNLLPK